MSPFSPVFFFFLSSLILFSVSFSSLLFVLSFFASLLLLFLVFLSSPCFILLLYLNPGKKQIIYEGL